MPALRPCLHLLFVSCLLAACSSTRPPEQYPAAQPAHEGAAPSITMSSTPPEPANLSAAETISILFEAGSTRLSAEAGRQIHSIAARLSADRSLAISLTAFTTHLGSREYAMAIADKRNHAIARELTRLGALKTQVKYKTYGSATGRQNPCATPACAHAARVDARYLPRGN